MIRDLIRLICDILSEVARDINHKSEYVHEYHPKTYGTRIKR